MVTRIKTAVVDNHPISRAGIKLVLQETLDFIVVGEGSNGQDAIELAKKIPLDLILMDVNMPNTNGIEATRTIHEMRSDIIIVAFSGFNHIEIQEEILRAGASGYVSKETEYTEMLEILRMIIDGKRKSSPADENLFRLTYMERQILTLLAEGMERQQIADRLFVSINTVKMHFRNLYQKLGVANAHDAIKVAINHGLIS